MITLHDAAKVSEQEIGGKAYRLAKMVEAGFRVKNAFVLTATEVDNLNRSKFIRDCRGKLHENCSWAVRSSAVGEDGETASWAGQYQTILFVPKSKVFSAVKECCAARDSETVQAYAKQQGVTAGRLSLLIQEMVDAQVAGVLFTTNPMQPNKPEMVIEAVEGVGESLVSGERTPARYFVSEDGVLMAKEGAEMPELSQVQINELVQIAKSVRQLFGKEQDIEWAYEKGTDLLYLLQSRDITTLNKSECGLIKLREETIATVSDSLDNEAIRLAGLGLDVKNDILSDQNVAELLTPHPCHLALSLFNHIFAHGGAIQRGRKELGYDIGEELDEGFFRLVSGQPRCSIVHDACTYRIAGFGLGDYSKLVGWYLDQIAADKRLGNYPEVVLYNQDPSQEFLTGLYGEEKAKELRKAYDIFFENLRVFEKSVDEQCQLGFIPEWHKAIAAFRQQPSGEDAAALLKQFDHLLDLLREKACVEFVKGARLGFFAFARLRRLLLGLFGNQADFHLNTLTAGIPLSRNPNLRFNAALASVRKGELDLHAVVEEYGHMALHQLEISVPRYADNPGLVEQLVGQTTGNPEKETEENTCKSQEHLRKLVDQVGDCGDELAHEVQMARTYLSMREMVKFEYLKAYHLLRQVVCKLNNHLLGWEEDLIFNLSVQEIKELASSECQNRLKEVAQGRKEQRKIERALYVPAVIESRFLEEIGNPQASADGNFLHGFGVTNEVTEGEAVVMRSFDDQESLALLGPGKILVTVTTDPAWSPVLALVGKSGGLVTEIGGMLAHGAIYAREMGFAAVLNVPQATSIIKTGMKIRVNGPGQYVEILSH